MTGKRKQAQVAKTMFKQSLNGKGFVDTQEVHRILKETIALKPAGLINILKTYKKLIEAKIAQEEVTIETTSKIPNQKQMENEILKKTGGKTIRYKVNPKIVFGAKIIHGDWVYDTTLTAKLNQLTKTYDRS